MIEINIDPNLFHLGPFLITWHGLFTAIGVLAGVWLTARLVRGTKISEDDVYTVALWAVPGGIVGARLLFAIENYKLFENNLLGILAINEGGISIWGAVLGGTLAGIIGARFHKVAVAQLADVAGLGLVLGQIIGRIGDVINGEHHGAPTDLPFGVVYTHPNTLGEPGKAVHLAVGYEMVWNLLVLGGLLWLRRRVRLPDGALFLLYLIFYSIGRFWTSFFRQDLHWLFDLSLAQLLSIATLIIAIPWLFYLFQQGPTAEPATSKAPAPGKAKIRSRGR